MDAVAVKIGYRDTATRKRFFDVLLGTVLVFYNDILTDRVAKAVFAAVVFVKRFYDVG